MGKKELPPQCLIPVRPILIVGATVEGKANFFEAGGGGVVSTDPPMVALPIRHERYTLKGILANSTFSVNIPSVELTKEADYCGIVSGAETDKARDCHFNVFYGRLKTAPMVEQCPINMECTVNNTIRSNSHFITIGRIEATYISEELLTEGKPDWNKISPLLWFPNKTEYVAIGNTVGKSRSIGNELKSSVD